MAPFFVRGPWPLFKAQEDRLRRFRCTNFATLIEYVGCEGGAEWDGDNACIDKGIGQVISNVGSAFGNGSGKGMRFARVAGIWGRMFTTCAHGPKGGVVFSAI